MTNAEAWFNKSLRPRKPEGSLGRTAQDGHLDSHTAPELKNQRKRWSHTHRAVCFADVCMLCFKAHAPLVGPHIDGSHITAPPPGTPTLPSSPPPPPSPNAHSASFWSTARILTPISHYRLPCYFERGICMCIFTPIATDCFPQSPSNTQGNEPATVCFFFFIFSFSSPKPVFPTASQ